MISIVSILIETYTHCIEMKLFRNFINFGQITVGALRTMIFNKNFSMTTSGQKHYTTAMVNGLITRDTFKIWGFAGQL